MKIDEARRLYSSQIKSYHEQQMVLSKQKKELEHKINITPDGKNVYANNTEAFAEGPEVVEVADTMAAAAETE